MNQNSENPMLCLASASPRRRELLSSLGLVFTVVVPDIDESPLGAEDPAGYVKRLALAKAQAGHAMEANPLPVLGADTTVVCDGELLGKPRDFSDARRMLQRLSGREHQVLSAVSMVDQYRHNTLLSVSTVRFRRISEAEIAAYWHSGEPADKAGAYAIQGGGALFTESLAGSYSGVVGLPLFETGLLLAEFGIHPAIICGEPGSVR